MLDDVDLVVGTCGWSYPDWVGPFYPPGTPSGQMLERYARVFDTVEVNSTFYAIPPIERTRGWAEATPDGFDFSVKAPRDLTHEARLDLDEGADALAAFRDAIEPLGSKLAVVLIQLPPSLEADEGRDRLEDLLASDAIGAPVAVEARNASWDQPGIYGMLDDHDATWVWSENDRWTSTPARTSRRAYVRLLGDRELESFDRLQRDPVPAIDSWQEHLTLQAGAIDEARVYANNHFAGFGPATANAVLQEAGREPRTWGRAGDDGQATLGDFGH